MALHHLVPDQGSRRFLSDPVHAVGTQQLPVQGRVVCPGGLWAQQAVLTPCGTEERASTRTCLLILSPCPAAEETGSGDTWGCHAAGRLSKGPPQESLWAADRPPATQWAPSVGLRRGTLESAVASVPDSGHTQQSQEAGLSELNTSRSVG